MAELCSFAATEDRAVELYRCVLRRLTQFGVPSVVGGTFALELQAGLARQTKDLDLFVRREDCERLAAILRADGIACSLKFSHWLAKAERGRHFVDLVFALGNGLARVDDEWLAHGVQAPIFGIEARICGAEEMILSKAFVMERDPFDGADVQHILRHSAATLDWTRLLRLFDEHGSVLLSHLILFLFVYPSHRYLIPEWVLKELWDRRYLPTDAQRLCRGTLLSRSEYLVDVENWRYEDGRRLPHGSMTSEDIAEWSAPIDPGARSSPAEANGRATGSPRNGQTR